MAYARRPERAVLTFPTHRSIRPRGPGADPREDAARALTDAYPGARAPRAGAAPREAGRAERLAAYLRSIDR